MKTTLLYVTFLGFLFSLDMQAQTVNVTVDAVAGQHKISPFIYGRNNLLSSVSKEPLKEADWQLIRDAGVKIVRENGGNNATKYNWRKKITSHPDWYNNVYDADWDYEVSSMQENLPSLTGIWSFQLIGRVATNKNNNFNDWGYNQSNWWSGVNQNLAGGGTVNPSGGGKALKEGNMNLYTQQWPADSTFAIVPHWINDLHIDKKHIIYWNMDNEVEIWSSTHDDVMPVQIPAEDFVQRYIEVAKKAKALYPDIKLLGPVAANEWQWYGYDNKKITYQGNNYVWLEYFIKRLAEEQKSSGVKLLDILDIHFYPGESSAQDILQTYRVFFDKNYNYPGANGVKLTGASGWDDSVTKEYIFERCRSWLNTYMGENNGVSFGVTETGIKYINANVSAVWHASILGEFARQNVEIFTPWSWDKGMWETLHLFSRYGKEISVQAVSSNETDISAYPSLNVNNDSMTVFLVNRNQSKSQLVNLQLSNFVLDNGNYSTLTLDNLPENETFISHTSNALKNGTVSATNNNISVTLPKLSVTAILLKGSANSTEKLKKESTDVSIFPNPSGGNVRLDIKLDSDQDVNVRICDFKGKTIKNVLNKRLKAGANAITLINSDLQPGVYLVSLSIGKEKIQKKMVVQ